MAMSKVFKFEVIMDDFLDNWKEEDIVKNLWPGMYTFLTRRHGVNKGSINLEDGTVVINWTYEDTYDEDEESE